MSLEALPTVLRVALAGLLLSACGGPPEPEQGRGAGEPLGAVDAALCSGVSVTSLVINGASSYEGVLSAEGTWSVSLYSNAVRLEYYVNGTLRTVEERPYPSGTWHFSHSPYGCGTHTLEVRAYPMIIDSNRNRTTCFDNSPRTITQPVTQACPTASLSCTRTSSIRVTCTGSASGGTGFYTAFWQEDYLPAGHPEWNWSTNWGAGSWSKSYICHSTTSFFGDRIEVEFKARDSSGMESAPSATTLYCAAGSIPY